MLKKSICLLSVIMLVMGLSVAYHCSAAVASTQFSDVPEKEWYAESVEYVHSKGLMNGVTQTSFEPETYITRGMIVTIIYRMEASPEIEGDLKFNDVNETYYYAKPIIWATRNNIVNGYDEDIFAPEDKITREQFATILYRYAKYKGVDVWAIENVSGQFEIYSDGDMISDYAKESMLWANSSKLITGVTTTTLVPQGIATRAQAATIFMRFDRLIEQTKGDNSDDTSDGEEKVESDNKKPNNKQNDSPDKEASGSKSDGTSNKTPGDKENNGSGKDNEDVNAGEWDDIKDNKDGKDDKDSEDEITSPTIFVDSAVAEGEYVDVVISVKNNPGIASLKFDVEFDDRSLKLVSVEFDSQWGSYITAPTPYNNPQNVSLISPFQNITKNGRLAMLKFEILDEAYEKSITIKCDKNNIFNSDFDEIEFDVINGEIKNKE